MGALLGNIVFLQPWILAALGALPILYFLLKITPPAPKLIRLPSARFLEGLKPETKTSSKTPWWILLLRLLIAALVIFALARPVYNPSSTLPGSGAISLVIDNSWAAAQSWDKQMRAAEDTIKRAGREKRDLYIQTTANMPGEKNPVRFGPMADAEALSVLKGLTPYPWSADYEALAKQLKENRPQRTIHSIWFSHGLDEGGFNGVLDTLSNQGGVSLISPDGANFPLLLKPAQRRGQDVQILIDAPDIITPGIPVSVQVLGEDGRMLDQTTVSLVPEDLPQAVQFDIPELLKSETSAFRLSGQYGAGGVYTLDERFKRRSVGIAGSADEQDTKPFIEATFYLTRALEPSTAITTGSVEELLEAEPSTLILPDIGAMPPETLNALEQWVKNGGLLLRFAGPNMTASNTTGGGKNYLLPVPLRPNTRATEGTLSWDTAPKLAPFEETSPFYGIEIHEDITVRQQILPDPSGSLEGKIWARLDDDTPLITASTMDKGLLVMVHTSASPEWSDLALSGTYVEILRRLVSISGLPTAQLQNAQGTLQPIWVLDGFGVRQSPSSHIRPIQATDFEATAPSSIHPPGLYGRGGHRAILNLGDHIQGLKAPSNIPVTIEQRIYDTEYERDLMPYFLYAALALLLLDWLIMIALVSGLRALPRFAAVVFLFVSVPAHASSLEMDMKYAEGLYLAYIKTGNPSLDATSQKGLENLKTVLSRRTSAEPVGVAALNPETDTLAFFPLIYWPISESAQSLTSKGLKNIQLYLDNGGTILFDTRDQNSSSNIIGATQNAEVLKTTIGALSIPPLQPINDDHVLSRSFYLLTEFPGLYSGGTLWVENNSANSRDGVSSVIIGGHDWASAWAASSGQRSGFSGGSRQQEMAFRFGVNIMMYALTGNYKADQVHVPHILERLGQ